MKLGKIVKNYNIPPRPINILLEGNYVKIDNAKGYEWENLAMAAKFSGMDHERGFIMLHVDINQYSPQLVGSILEFLNSKNSNDVNRSLTNCLSAMKSINERRK